MVDAVKWVVLLFVVLPVAASPALPYDEAADAAANVAAGLEQADHEGKQLLLTFGANWCLDCRVLATALQEAPLADLIAAHFVVVKVDVGNWDKNVPLVKQWGNPIGKGIPAIVVANGDGGIVYTSRAGELADARHMGTSGLLQFFNELVDRGH
jgi:protein disulfide-isomerase